MQSWRHNDFIQGPPKKRRRLCEFSSCFITTLDNTIIEALKYHSLGILKGDQIYAISMDLSERYAKGTTSVGYNLQASV